VHFRQKALSLRRLRPALIPTLGKTALLHHRLALMLKFNAAYCRPSARLCRASLNIYCLRKHDKVRNRITLGKGHFIFPASSAVGVEVPVRRIGRP
ncbi:MAG TPA: hypothetical protein VFK46_05780, partial [Candidatus Macondimonas sp.]|nr:hypothetical protein [Candidatus Macondimonas sp.]